MSIVVQQNTLGGLPVRDAMRMEVVHTSATASIQTAVRLLLKHKVNALLVTDSDDQPVGVVSKTDIVGAYYASLPAEYSVQNIMMAPPIFCSSDDLLESALDMMRSASVYRLYVMGKVPARVIGVLAYPDIVGLLYRYCHDCENSLLNKKRAHKLDDASTRFRLRDAMTSSVTSFPEDADLLQIMEGLSAYRFGAVLIMNWSGAPRGVISKTDLIRAYARGVPAQEPARAILPAGHVISSDEEDFVEDAIRKMIFSGVHRLFVYRKNKERIVGVFSLSNAARLRSGSCHACVSSRIRVAGDT
ncbi:MAG: CBS domain-containing protein [Desulfomonile tiedjei]|nr:CBS domain-containing protein [Desulfomonile tiedjei]